MRARYIRNLRSYPWTVILHVTPDPDDPGQKHGSPAGARMRSGMINPMPDTSTSPVSRMLIMFPCPVRGLRGPGCVPITRKLLVFRDPRDPPGRSGRPVNPVTPVPDPVYPVSRVLCGVPDASRMRRDFEFWQIRRNPTKFRQDLGNI